MSDDRASVRIPSDSSSSSQRVTRRRLLLGAGGFLGLLAGGGGYVRWSLQGEHDPDAAPSTFPVVSTRGLVADDGSVIPQSGDASVQTDGVWEFDTTDELFVFVHGLNTDPASARDLAYTVERGLEGIHPIPGICYSWDSDTGWDTAKRIATGNGQLLTVWLSRWAETDGRPIHLIGYSLGARVSAEALRVLDTMDRRNALRSVSLLGGAIPHDSVTRDGRYGDAIEAFDGPVNNFYSSADRVLGWVYRAAERTRAVGSHGISDPTLAPSEYQDVDVTDTVADHYSYFAPGEGCLPQVVEHLP